MSDQDSRSGLEYKTAAIMKFVEDVHSPQDESLEYALKVLKENDMPEIQIAAMEGKTLQLLLSMIKAEKVLELGTLSGYSGLWMLRGIKKGGKLITVEYEPKHAEVAADVFRHAGVENRVEILQGAGMDVLDEIKKRGPFDAVFIDADKHNYENYARFVFDLLNPGGLIIGDNAYLFGDLAGKEPQSEEDKMRIAGMQGFHKFLAEKTVSVCLPTPDGLAVGLKL